MRRYSLQPLVDASGLSEHALGLAVGLSGSSLVTARRLGFSEAAADKYACRLGLVPWLVWSDWLEDLEVECAERSCSVRFVPSRKGHRFHTRKCYYREKNREAQRRRYQNDPVYREQKKAATRAYAESARRALRVKQAAWRAANRERINAAQRAYYQENRERILAQQAERDRARRAA